MRTPENNNCVVLHSGNINLYKAECMSM